MKKNIGILFGGYSREAEVSRKSAQTVFENIDTKKYSVYLIEMTADDKFFLYLNNQKFPYLKDQGLVFKLPSTTIAVDLVFNMIHGSPGEDGKLQSILNYLPVYFTGSLANTMAITFNKFYCNQILANQGFNVAKQYLFRKNYKSCLLDDLIVNFKGPYFVKPNSAGSSLGISKVSSPNQLIPAIQKSMSVGHEALVEELLVGTEITVGVIEYQGKIRVLPVTAITSSNELFDFEAKYSGKSTEITPAQISMDNTKLAQNTAMDIFKLFNCRGMARIDMMITADGIYIIEVNTIPGFTRKSFLPQQLAVANISIQDLITDIIENGFAFTK